MDAEMLNRLGEGFQVRGEDVTITEVEEFVEEEERTKLTNHGTPVPVTDRTRMVRLHFEEDVEPVEVNRERMESAMEYL